MGAKNQAHTHDFNPLPPCGGRPASMIGVKFSVIFQSTPSVWRETRSILRAGVDKTISIHSLRVEGDVGAGIA